MITRKTVTALFVCVLLVALSQASIAAVKTYDLKVSGCWN